MYNFDVSILFTGENMKIIDWEAKRIDTIRFYLGNDDLKEWRGDNWGDKPYEHNAGRVYDEFINGIIDITFDDGDLIFEPWVGYRNSPYSKDDFMNRKAPCIIIIKNKDVDWDHWPMTKYDTFQDWLDYEKTIKIYFGDNIQEVLNHIR